MAPLWLTLLLPTVELIGAGWLYRTHRKRYPAFLSYLLTESAWNLTGLIDYHIQAGLGTPFRMMMRVWWMAEVFHSSRSVWSWAEARTTGAWAVAAAAFAAGGAWIWSGLSPLQGWFIFRQYFHLVLAAGAWALIVCSLRWPMLEARRNRALRWGAAVWLTVLALGSSFVPGGIGYALAPYHDGTWRFVRVAVLVALILTTAGTTAGMGGSLPKRKDAARAGDVWLRKAA